MENEVLLGFELVCCDQYFECSADPSLTLREIVEGLQEMSPPEIREEFDLCQPLIASWTNKKQPPSCGCRTALRF